MLWRIVVKITDPFLACVLFSQISSWDVLIRPFSFTKITHLTTVFIFLEKDIMLPRSTFSHSVSGTNLTWPDLAFQGHGN